MKGTSRLGWLLFFGVGFSCPILFADSAVSKSDGQTYFPANAQNGRIEDEGMSDKADDSIYDSYPKGFYLGAGVNVFYRDMRGDSSWRFVYNETGKHKNPSWGPALNLELGYQVSQHWGFAAQTGWVSEQKVTASNTTSSFSRGDYKKSQTCWAAALLRTRLQMDYRYYFIAEFGPAFTSQSLKSLSTSTLAKTRDNKILPTAIIGIQYRATENLNVGLQYQVIWGQQNWRDTWVVGYATRYPPLQMLGIELSYEFNT
jgi:hypothetical protein